jgi:hypothetical protein
VTVFALSGDVPLSLSLFLERPLPFRNFWIRHRHIQSVFVGMFTPPRHLIPPLVYLGVFVCRNVYSSYTPDPTNDISRGPCLLGCSLLLDTWSHLWYIQGSVFIGMFTPPRCLIPPLVYPGVCVGMLTPPRHLIPPLIYPGVCVGMLTPPKTNYPTSDISRGLCLLGCLFLLDTWSHLWYIQGSVFVGMLTPPKTPDPTSDISRGLCL